MAGVRVGSELDEVVSEGVKLALELAAVVDASLGVVPVVPSVRRVVPGEVFWAL